LKREIAGCEILIRNHKENELSLKKIMDDQSTALSGLEVKNGSCISHPFLYAEDKFVRELEGVKHSILKAIQKEN